jgi:hypothetical protein
MVGADFVLTVDGISVSAAQDLFELNVPATQIAVIKSLVIGQSSDAGDAEDEQQRVRFLRGATTSGSGGSAVTALGPYTYAGTAERNNTTVATGGTPTTRHADGWNVRSGYVWMPSEEDMIVVPPSTRFVVNLPSTPADAITVSATLHFQAIG